MNRIMFIAVAALAAILIGCGGGSNDSSASGLQDGIYFAQQSGFGDSGWKYMVTVEVDDGKIADVVWNGAHVEAGTDKITRSASGEYGMVARGGAQAEWHEQAATFQDYLVEVQDLEKITYDEDGNTDAVSGVSIHVSEFVELVEQALAAAPTGYGDWADGAYHAEGDEFHNGYKDRVDITVISGYIVAAYWNPISEDGSTTKNAASEEGGYPMVARGGAQAEWYVQADAAEEALLESQDPAAIPVDDDGHTDAISGVSITVSEFLDLAAQALAGHRR